MTHSHLIIPRLYVGDWMAAKTLQALLENNISHVVAVGGFDYKHNGIIYKVCCVEFFEKKKK